MGTTVDEIAPGIFRISTWTPDITEHGFTFNQFLLTGDDGDHARRFVHR